MTNCTIFCDSMRAPVNLLGAHIRGTAKPTLRNDTDVLSGTISCWLHSPIARMAGDIGYGHTSIAEDGYSLDRDPVETRMHRPLGLHTVRVNANAAIASGIVGEVGGATEATSLCMPRRYLSTVVQTSLGLCQEQKCILY